jgi:hypothetical protein
MAATVVGVKQVIQPMGGHMPADMRYHLPREAGTQHLSNQQVTMHPHRHLIPFLSFLAPAPTAPLHTRTPLSWTRVVVVRTSVHLIATQAIAPRVWGRAAQMRACVSLGVHEFYVISPFPFHPPTRALNTHDTHTRTQNAHGVDDAEVQAAEEFLDAVRATFTKAEDDAGYAEFCKVSQFALSRHQPLSLVMRHHPLTPHPSLPTRPCYTVCRSFFLSLHVSLPTRSGSCAYRFRSCTRMIVV